MGYLGRIAAALLALGPLIQIGAEDGPPRSTYGPAPAASPGSTGPAEAATEILPEPEIEHFALWPAGAGPLDRPLGALRLVRLQRPGAAWMVEQDLLLFDPPLRVLLVERHDVDLCHLTHREIAAGAGRTLRARWPQPGARPPLGVAQRERDWEPLVTQWSGTERRVESFAGARGWAGPLGLIERQRWGLQPPGPAVRFEPLSGRPEELRVSLGSFGGPGSGWRLYRWRGLEGAGRGWMLYWGRELVALAWQSGGSVARRIQPEVYAELTAGYQTTELSD